VVSSLKSKPLLPVRHNKQMQPPGRIVLRSARALLPVVISGT
jgi:hypothetical protein